MHLLKLWKCESTRWCKKLEPVTYLHFETRCTTQQEGIFSSRGRHAFTRKVLAATRARTYREEIALPIRKQRGLVYQSSPPLAERNHTCKETWRCSVSLGTKNKACWLSPIHVKKTLELISLFSHSCGSNSFCKWLLKIKIQERSLQTVEHTYLVVHEFESIYH